MNFFSGYEVSLTQATVTKPATRSKCAKYSEVKKVVSSMHTRMDHSYPVSVQRPEGKVQTELKPLWSHCIALWSAL